MPEDRRLAAIMFTDIVGYTALMGSDENEAFQLLRKNRDLQKPLIKKYKGEWLKEMGDGILASFSTASDAVRCAGEIQNAAKKAGLPLRIGIHEGEVVFEGSDVLGDGVNVASRLEELAEEGCINISGAVYKDIKNKAGIEAEFVEEKVLKNVEEPVKVYRVQCAELEQEVLEEKSSKKETNKLPYYIIAGLVLLIAAILIWQLLPSKTTAPVAEETETIEIDKSIAVLPFKNLSKEEENQYFADGVAEGILNHLSKIKDLRVLSRSSTEQYRENVPPSQQMAEELDVTYLLEASVFKSEDKIRVTAQLIDATKDEHLWSEQYDRELSDVFEVMSDISQEVASEVRVVIAPEEKERIEKIPTTNVALYDIYLKAKENHNDYWTNNDKSSLDKAVVLYQTAIEIDSSFALAYTGLAWAYWSKHYWDEYFEEDFLDSVLVLANLALSYDDQLEEAYQVRGKYYQQNGEIQQAIDDFEKAIAINPNYADALLSLGDVYYNDSVKAISSIHKAVNIEKGSALAGIYYRLGRNYMDVGLLEESKYYYQKFSDLNNDSIGYLRCLGLLELCKGNIEKAIEFYENAEKIESTRGWNAWLGFSHFLLDHPEESYKHWSGIIDRIMESGIRTNAPVSIYGYTLWQLGRKEEANYLINEYIRQLEGSIKLKRPHSRRTAYFNLAVVSFFLGEKQKGYQCFEKYSNEQIINFHMITEIKYSPMLKNVREEPRFQSIVKNIEEKNQKERERVVAWMEEEGIALK